MPGALVALLIARIVVDGLRDPTSHNLWPFEVLIVGVPCTLAMGLLFVLRRLRVAR